jgi:UDP-3-O-[3-hydroxymyristoyl] N-acetylglucosamine deacetylase
MHMQPHIHLSTTVNPVLVTPKAVGAVSLMQTTLAASCVFSGVGVHRGLPVQMSVSPAPANTGYLFVRTDVADNNEIPAVYSAVVDTRMSTTIANDAGVTVSTIEHIIAALVGANISNAIIEIDGPEVPIMDGSSIIFANAFASVGVVRQKSKQKTLVIKSPVRVESATGFVEFIPSLDRTYNVYYDFSGRFDGTPYEKGFNYNLDTDSFADLLADARTFGLYEDAVKLQSSGLAKGASLQNTVVLKDMCVMNEDGLRSNDEFVRHKVLDAIGDIGLAGCAIIGAYRAHNPGHDLNNRLLRAVFNASAC